MKVAGADTYRAPIRARTLERDRFEGALHAVRNSLVGIGERLDRQPDSLDEAISSSRSQYGEKAGRMLARFAALPDSSYLWTRTAETEYWLGRLTGPWRYDNSAAAKRIGIHHIRPARWQPEPLGLDSTPAAVIEAFDRGGRNLQRINDAEAAQESVRLWRLNE